MREFEKWKQYSIFRKKVRREIKAMNLRLCIQCKKKVIGDSVYYTKPSKTDPNICYPCNHQADYAQVLKRTGEKSRHPVYQ